MCEDGTRNSREKKLYKSKDKREAKKESSKVITSQGDEMIQTFESLILAQDKRWRRA